jgi:hypothetical protein
MRPPPLALSRSARRTTTWQKLSFYAGHHVDEVLIVDLEERAVAWLALCRRRARAG